MFRFSLLKSSFIHIQIIWETSQVGRWSIDCHILIIGSKCYPSCAYLNNWLLESLRIYLEFQTCHVHVCVCSSINVLKYCIECYISFDIKLCARNIISVRLSEICSDNDRGWKGILIASEFEQITFGPFEVDVYLLMNDWSLLSKFRNGILKNHLS